MIGLKKYISNENTAYLFEISIDVSNISQQGPNSCYVALRGYVWLAIALKQGRASPFFIAFFWIPSW